MSTSLSANQMRARLLSFAKFPMLAAVLLAAALVIRVPLMSDTQQAQSHSPSVQPRYETVAIAEYPHEFAAKQTRVKSPRNTRDALDATEPSATPEPASDHRDMHLEITDTDYQGSNDDAIAQQNGDLELPDTAAGAKAADGDKSAVNDDGDAIVELINRFDNVREWFGPSGELAPASGRVLHLRNPSNNRIDVRFVVDRKTYHMSPGEYIEFSEKDGWSVMFHRGGDFGNSRRILPPGTYLFSVTDRGWKLSTSVLLEEAANSN